MGISPLDAAQTFDRSSALKTLRAYESKFCGNILEIEGCTCTVSFPGVYCSTWDRVVSLSKADTISAAGTQCTASPSRSLYILYIHHRLYRVSSSSSSVVYAHFHCPLSSARVLPLSSSVVFLPEHTTAFGQHGSDKCYCVEMYGEIKVWGCKW
jgi:hypothetical protein